MRVAVWGLGRHAVDNVLPALSATPGLELHGVCSRNAEMVSRCSSDWNCRGWTDPEGMLSGGDVDVVYVATPTGLHAEHGTLVLDAGKHLWCEKPLTATRQSTVDLLERSRLRQRSVCEGFMYLYHPQFRQLLQFLADEKLGAIRSITCRFGLPALERPGFRFLPELGGGALLDVGCYPVSVLHALFPEATHTLALSRVFARGGAAVDTDGYAVFELSSGVVANLEWRFAAAYRNEVEIWGDGGSLFVDRIFSKRPDYVPVFRFRNGQGAESTTLGEPADHFVCMLRGFRAIACDALESEAERRRIAWRAEVLDQIRYARPT